MNNTRIIYAITLAGLLVACREPEDLGPYVPTVCTEDMLTRPVIATREPDGTITLIENGECGRRCNCQEDGTGSTCDWELTHITGAPGLYRDLPSTCVECWGGEGEEEGEAEGFPENTETLEIVRVDQEGVAGCVLGACDRDFRFEATWCPD